MVIEAGRGGIVMDQLESSIGEHEMAIRATAASSSVLAPGPGLSPTRR
jgi:hypothetical protein